MTAATYDGNGLRASETSTPPGRTQDFVWNTTSSVPSLLMDSTNAYIFAGSGTPAEQVNLSTGTIVYLVADSLGSVRGVVSVLRISHRLGRLRRLGQSRDDGWPEQLHAVRLRGRLHGPVGHDLPDRALLRPSRPGSS